MTERSWRDSTISALEKVITDGEEDTDGEGMKSEGLKEVRISSPVPDSFHHVDGTIEEKEVRFVDIYEDQRRDSRVVERAI
jgi:hypothetical protein